MPFRFRYHPLPEQRAIAHVLGTLDDKIELNRRMNETLEEMARALFKSWFVDFLPVRAKMAAKQNNPSLLFPQAESGTWFVYAIECADGSLYIGQTENLRQRWLQHSSSKGGRWTKSHPPQRVAYWEKQPSRQAAVEREKWLKTGFGRKWLKKEIATRTQTGDPVRAKIAGRDTGLPPDVADLFPDRLVDSDLGKIPEGWEVKSVSDFASIKGGKQLPKDKFVDNGPVPVFGGAGLMGHTDNYNADGYVISVGRVGAYCGQFFAYQGRAWINNNASLIAQYKGIPGEWLLLALRNLDIDLIKKGAAQPFVSNSDLAAMKLIAPIDSTLDAFRRLSEPLSRCSAQINGEVETLIGLRNTLLSKLISGKIRVRDVDTFLGRVL